MQLLIALFASLALSGIVEPLLAKSNVSGLIVAVTAEGPDLTDQVSPHFGHSNFCKTLEPNSDEGESLLELDPIHNGVDLVSKLIDLEVKVVITGRIGPNALSLLRTARLKVIPGVSGTVGDALKQFKSGHFDWRSPPGKKKEKNKMKRNEKLVVVGCGGAGGPASILAKKLMPDVIVTNIRAEKRFIVR